MSNTLRISQKREWIESAGVNRPGQLRQIAIVTTSDLIDEKTQIVGTAHEVIAVGDMTDDAYVEISNPHATAVVQIGIDDSSVFVPLIDIPPGYPAAVIPQASALADLCLKSSVASTPVRVTLVKIVAPA
jgi:hypothetical protein